MEPEDTTTPAIGGGLQRVPPSVAWAGVLLLGTAILLPSILGALWPAYSSSADYLSELGAIGAPYAFEASTFSFLATAILAGYATVRMALVPSQSPLARAGWLVCTTVAIAYAGAFLFPCDPGCPLDGSERQRIHNLGAFLEYPGAVLGLALLAMGAVRDGRIRLAVLTAVPLVAILAALAAWSFTTAPPGLVQRVGDFSFFLWLFAATREWAHRTERNAPIST